MSYRFRLLFLLFLLLLSISIKAQSYPPAVGYEGSTAIHKDNHLFVDWANAITISRGFLDIAQPEEGLVTYGNPENALGKADGGANIVSLGDGGSALLEFENPIVNGIGIDFAVFENGFFEETDSEMAFLELAFVEVSTDGIEFIRFPSVTEIQNDIQLGSFESCNARYLHNFAGKYTAFYGTGFDLEDLKPLITNSTVNLNEINYIKIIDVVGCIDPEWASFDSLHNLINDPYPTPFASGGFDLDAVGVLHNTLNNTVTDELIVYPNPTNNDLYLKTNDRLLSVKIFSSTGQLMLSNCQTVISVEKLVAGCYIACVETDKKCYYKTFIKE